MKPSIEVEGVSKAYRISHQKTAEYETIKDSFSRLVRKPFGGSTNMTSENFWALKDVSFSVNPGEVFGIMGHNGSGKSTMLKILSRIIEPTKGKATLNGRVASLLEVGTGFHPELTGRENIFFNGSMLGMSRREIIRKFNDIVEFAEIEKFLDTPVKFYSSGMYVRLAFAVAAHLEPEILILDEVLAVGDASFQEKSRRKILSTMEQGSTVLFVSHSVGAVRQICTKGMLLDHGKVKFIGGTDELVDEYTELMRNSLPEQAIRTIWENDGTVKNDLFVPSRLYLTDSRGKIVTKPIPNNEPHYVVIEADVKYKEKLLTVGYGIYNENKTLMYMSYFSDTGNAKPLPQGKIRLIGELPAHYLNAGAYKISILGGIHNKLWLFEPGTHVPSIEATISGGLSDSKFWVNPREGLMAPLIKWRHD